MNSLHIICSDVLNEYSNVCLHLISSSVLLSSHESANPVSRVCKELPFVHAHRMEGKVSIREQLVVRCRTQYVLFFPEFSVYHIRILCSVLFLRLLHG